MIKTPERPKDEVPVRSYDVDLLTKPLADCRPTLNPGAQYRIVRYYLFSNFQFCFVCQNSLKAKQVIAIRNESTGALFESGLDCMEKNFPVERAALFKTASVLKPLLSDWRRLYREVSSADVPQFIGTDDALRHMHEYLGNVVSFPSRATSQVEAMIAAMTEDTAGIQSGYYDANVNAARTFLALQREHRFFEWMLKERKRFYSDHPRVAEQSWKQVEPIFAEDSGATLTMYKTLYVLSKELKVKKIPVSIHQVPPYRSPNESLYQLRLDSEMRRLADQLSESEEMVKARGSAIVGAAQKVQHGGAELLALADSNNTKLQNYDPREETWAMGTLNKLGVEIYVSSLTKPYEKSGLKIDTRTGEVRDTGKGESGYFKGAAVWKPEPYHAAHAAVYNLAAKHLDDDYARAEKALADVFSFLSESVQEK